MNLPLEMNLSRICLKIMSNFEIKIFFQLYTNGFIIKSNLQRDYAVFFSCHEIKYYISLFQAKLKTKAKINEKSIHFQRRRPTTETTLLMNLTSAEVNELFICGCVIIIIILRKKH